MNAGETEEIELQLLLEALVRVGGYDFREYDATGLRRLVADCMRLEGVTTISALQDRVLHDESALDRFVVAMAGRRRELFYSAEFFHAFREHVVPLLQTYSFVRLWLPANGTGEDAYSIAVLLDELGLLGRCVIYSTSISDLAADLARKGEYEIASRSSIASAMSRAGFTRSIEDVARIEDNRLHFGDRIRDAIMFARHDPTAPGSINEFHAIVARNVFPLFNGSAQYRIHQSIYESLSRLGFLCLGAGETLQGSVHERAYRRVAPEQSIYRRMR